MESNLEQLETFYSSQHKERIFCSRLCVKGKSFDILYDYDKKDEIDKFVLSFTEYLPYYVYTADTLECIDPTGDVSLRLAEISKKCWNGPNVPSRETRVNGIFGEVFLDFYERIVKKAKLASTYASRRDFNNNSENRGYDNVLFLIESNAVEFVFAESKFVTTKSSASAELIKDIKGEPAVEGKKEKAGHLTIEFMNRYITFIIEKSAFFSDEDRRLLKPFFQDLNNELINGKGDFISFLINRSIRVNCVFFAIFQDENNDPACFINEYDQIEAEAKLHLERMGLKNYGIEIVFIPTNAKSMEIKGAIDGYYSKI